MDLEKTQNDCDSTFCFCLERTVAEVAQKLNTTVKGCKNVANNFCDLVELFGSMAHRNAQAMVTTQIPTTTTTLTTTESSSVATSKIERTTVKFKPFEIAQFIVHNILMKCYDYRKFFTQFL